VFWVISVYFKIRNTLPKSGTFLLGHPVCILQPLKVKMDLREIGWNGVDWIDRAQDRGRWNTALNLRVP
jgi:hypothetical protein